MTIVHSSLIHRTNLERDISTTIIGQNCCRSVEDNDRCSKGAPSRISKQTAEQRNASRESTRSCVAEFECNLPPYKPVEKAHEPAFCRELRYQRYFRHLDESTRAASVCLPAIMAPACALQLLDENSVSLRISDSCYLKKKRRKKEGKSAHDAEQIKTRKKNIAEAGEGKREWGIKWHLAIRAMKYRLLSRSVEQGGGGEGALERRTESLACSTALKTSGSV